MADIRTLDKSIRSLSDIVRLAPRHLRSTQVARDYADPTSTEHYVVTPFVQGVTARLSQSLQRSSTARAWRLTGDYGSGKSSFALAFARYAKGDTRLLPGGFAAPHADVVLEPILVVGEREPLTASLQKGLLSAAERVLGRIPRSLSHLLKDRSPIDASGILRAIEEFSYLVKTRGLADGVLVVLDELGKNLEHAAMSPEHGDVYLLQQLAEAAARSADTPIVILAILHQAVTSYARDLSTAERREWEKVSGRFEEVVFAPPLEQTATLAATALAIDTKALPKALIRSLQARMLAAVEVGWYGAGAPQAELVQLASALAPLDPMVLPVLGRVLRRFGQNERSLFSFLSSAEPYGLFPHMRQKLEGFEPYRLHNLYDYLSANVSSALNSGVAATRWGVVEAVVRSSAAHGDVERQVLKTVGLINAIDDPGLTLTPDLICLAVAGTDPETALKARDAISRLTREARLLYDRGAGGGLCLWPHTSVDIDTAFSTALEIIGKDGDVINALRSVLPSQPLVARRHYIESGTLRHFDVEYTSLPELEGVLRQSLNVGQADGRLIVVLAKTDRERGEAIARLERFQGWTDTLLVGIPQPVGALTPLLRDLRAWRWVSDNTPALGGDRLAREEVGRQVALAEDRLRRSLNAVLDFRSGGAVTTRWIHHGQDRPVRTARHLTETLSDIFDQAYALSPKIRNELINRRALSSAAARARSLLIEGLAQTPERPLLGLDDRHTPPEMAIYLSVLAAGGVHVQRDGIWKVVEPDADPLNLRPSLHRVRELLTAQEDRRVPYSELEDELRKAPYGLRDGVIPLVIAIYLAIHWHRTAVYEEGTYLEQVGGPEFNRMLKESEHFALQHCEVEGIRAEVFTRLSAVIGIAPQAQQIDLLDVVRPLIKFVTSLPEQARKTRNLSVTAASVRSVLLRVQDPTALIFTDLPKACGLQSFSSSSPLDAEALDHFVSTMAKAVRELGNAYPALLEQIALATAHSFDTDGPVESLQAILIRRTEAIAASITDPDLKAFALRLADRGLTPRAWLEALGSFLGRKPPERWAEQDEREFHHRLKVMSRRLRRVQATSEGPEGYLERAPGHSAFRLVVTAADGRELEEIVASSDDDDNIRNLEASFSALLKETGRAGLVAAARALIANAAMSEDEPK